VGLPRFELGPRLCVHAGQVIFRSLDEVSDAGLKKLCPNCDQMHEPNIRLCPDGQETTMSGKLFWTLVRKGARVLKQYSTASMFLTAHFVFSLAVIETFSCSCQVQSGLFCLCGVLWGKSELYVRLSRKYPCSLMLHPLGSMYRTGTYHYPHLPIRLVCAY
jgi:hypothetical protein